MKRNRNPKYVKQYRDRAGRWINQYRRNNKLIRLPDGRDFTDDWWLSYYAAERAVLASEPRPIIGPEARSKPGSVGAALGDFFASNPFGNLSAKTQQVRRAVLERDVREVIGAVPLTDLGPAQIARLVDEKAQASPASAKVLLQALRGFMDFCVGQNLVTLDPTAGIKRPKFTSKRRHSWTDSEIEQFRHYWPIGSTPRLALELAVHTAQRGPSDVARISWAHIKNGWLSLVQRKTQANIEIPIHPTLAGILDTLPKPQAGQQLKPFLLNSRGKPFSASSYCVQFRKWCDAAGLPMRCTSHGLRYAFCTIAAELGLTPHEIMPYSGHKSLKEVERYTGAADRKRLAASGMAKLLAIRTGTKVSSGAMPLDKTCS